MYKRFQLLVLLLIYSQLACGVEGNRLVGDYSAHIQAGYAIWFELREDKSASYKTWSFEFEGKQSPEYEEVGNWVLVEGRVRIETKKGNFFVFGVKKGKVLQGGHGFILDIQESSLPADDLVMYHRQYYGRGFGSATN